MAPETPWIRSPPTGPPKIPRTMLDSGYSYGRFIAKASKKPDMGERNRHFLMNEDSFIYQMPKPPVKPKRASDSSYFAINLLSFNFRLIK
jgi:hypothetical protein